MKKLYYLLSIFLVLCSVESKSQQWVDYNDSKNRINTIFKKDKMFWMGMNNKAVKFDLSCGVYEHYTPQTSGIAGDAVYAIAEDLTGNMWFGTNAGLSKFDGQTWTNFTRTNSALPSDTISALKITPNGDFWIGTFSKGLAKYNGSTFVLYNTGNSQLSNDSIRAIEMGENGEFYFGTWGGGYCTFKQNIWANYSMPSSPFMQSNYILSFGYDSVYKDMWLGTANGLARTGLSGGLWKHAGVWAGHSDSITAVTIETSGGTACAATPDGFVYYTSDIFYQFLHHHFTSGDDNLSACSTADWDTVYVGTNSGQLTKYYRSILYDVIQYDVTPFKLVNDIALGKDGRIWIGVNSELVETNGRYFKVCEKLRNYQFVSVSKDNIVCMVDNNGNYFTYNDTIVQQLGYPSISGCTGIINDPKDGTIWSGSTNGLYYGGGLAYTALNSPLPSSYIKALLFDKDWNLWIGTDNGLAKLDTSGNWTIYNTSNSGLLSNDVSSLALKNGSEILVNLTYTVQKFNGSTWTQIINGQKIESVTVAKNGDVWACSSLKSVYKYDGTTVSQYDSSNSSLKSGAFREIIADTLGNVYLSSVGHLEILSTNGAQFSSIPHPYNLTISAYANRDGSVTGYDPNYDLIIPNMMAYIADATDTTFLTLDQYGKATGEIQLNKNYKIAPFTISNKNYKLNNDFVSLKTNFNTCQNTFISDFKFNAQGTVNDLRASIVSTHSPVPGSFNRNFVVVENIGTQDCMTASTKIAFDPASDFNTTSFTPPDTLLNNTLTWNLWWLPSLNSRVSACVNLKPDTAMVPGDKMFIAGEITNTVDDDLSNNAVSDSLTCASSFNLGSYIECSEDSITSTFIAAKNYLEYTVTINNLSGNDVWRYELTDTLSPKLDITTFEYIAGNCMLNDIKALPGNIIRIKAIDYIPLMQSDTGFSYSFMKFRIRPKAGLFPGDSILNRATITVDGRADTYTTHLSVVYIANTVTDLNEKNLASNDITVYPNPANDFINIYSSVKGNVIIKLFDLSGKLIQSNNYLNASGSASDYKLNLSDIPKGMYLLKLESESGSAIRKIVRL